jgi:hypothetical protein
MTTETAFDRAKALEQEATILQGDGCLITLAGAPYHIRAKTPRQARPLMAEMMRVLPRFQVLAASIKRFVPDAGVTLTPEQAAQLPLEVQAEMLDAFEPACLFIAQCADRDPSIIAALDTATEQEIIAAFFALQRMLQDPFVRAMKSRQNGTSQSVETPL